ncbi:MAG: ferritin family protein [Deltaproteobacteria bacterium]|jgi:rubrerythrin|nr:ferritin family protein [Deltaproteobacteria bacterium]
MSADSTIEILKQAILLEKRGHAFYSQVAGQASGKAVKQFFEMMAEEEVKHVNILSDQFKAYKSNSQFTPEAINDDHSDDVATRVLTGEMKKEISAADYEAAAISAAMSMEENAIKLYSGRAQQAEDPNEKALYDWLAKWEMQHLRFLSEIDKELKEAIWNDNTFWPF